MAFHLKNLKSQKDKFFTSMTGQQLCDMLQDGEIMNYINKIPIRRNELGTIFQAMGDGCDMRKKIAPGVRQKMLAPLVVQLSKIVKEYETEGKQKEAANAAILAQAEAKQKEAANAALLAQAEANRKAAENRQRGANAAVAAEAEAAAKAAANAQLRNAQAAAETAVAYVPENTALTRELKNFKKTMNNLSSRLNKAIENSRATRNVGAAAARRGGSRRRNTHTRKARNARKA